MESKTSSTGCNGIITLAVGDALNRLCSNLSLVIVTFRASGKNNKKGRANPALPFVFEGSRSINLTFKLSPDTCQPN